MHFSLKRPNFSLSIGTVKKKFRSVLTRFVSGSVWTWTLLVDAPIHTVDPPWQHQIDIAYGTGMLLLASTTCTSFVGFDVMAWFLIGFAGMLLLLQDVEEEWTIRSNQELEYV